MFGPEGQWGDEEGLRRDREELLGRFGPVRVEQRVLVGIQAIAERAVFGRQNVQPVFTSQSVGQRW